MSNTTPIITQIVIKDDAKSENTIGYIGAKAENITFQNGKNLEDYSKNIQDKIQFNEMPTASLQYLDTICQYIGTTTSTYTNGYFYKCVNTGTTTPNYNWTRINIQPNNGGSGLPSGGTTGQVLIKHSNTDYDVEWGAGSSSSLTPGRGIKINDNTISVNSLEVIGRYNVLDYGLVGDNSTDNSTAMEALLAQMPHYKSAVIYFPAGRYRFSRPIVINSTNDGLLGVTLIGDTVASKSYADGTSQGSPESTLIYDGAANTTFIKGGSNCWYFNVHNLHISCVDSFTYTQNTAEFDGTLPYNLFIPTVIKENIVGIGETNSMDISNCIFTGFSGSALETPIHTTVHNCSFNRCKIGINAQYDGIINDCWFNNCETAINVKPNDPTSQWSWTTLIINTTWIDQCTRGIYTSARSFSLYACGIMFDMFDEAAITCNRLANSIIIGHIQRAGIMYAGIPDSDRTVALVPQTDGIAANYIFNTKIEIAAAKRDIGKGKNKNGICPSRLITAINGTIESCGITNHAMDYADIIDTSMVTNLLNTEIHAKNNSTNLIKVNTLPTASVSEVGKIYLYNGESDPSQLLSKGCLYECVSDGESTPTYTWKPISFTVEMLQYVLNYSNDFNDFKTLILNNFKDPT